MQVYRSTVKIDEGDIQLYVASNQHELTFLLGLGSIALPLFFNNLTELLNHQTSYVEVDGWDYLTFYTFSRHGDQVVIKEKHDKYAFNIFAFCEAVDAAFKKCFRKMRLEGLLPVPVEDSEFHPLAKPTMDAYQRFTSAVNKKRI
ncbi:hypothetical protein ACFFJY_02600 [Fictibacillus aquaticus]|uniref:Uncharacterized protein n=1 Tax=Fictibacillus aquaticus TaxID=2021314 RepID=A0A235F999_9BACL|nr:hypothetical protein [Fictibacillus aquaticus]OYD57593.1 hypothetical protein CGZ90_13070 [Fictibacillus aquaticus]